ncbi:MAG: hypothetical protein JXA72_11585 [Bacteroidales bacterium]|nr:hypothetical protein [Bacteroidales bacterium]
MKRSRVIHTLWWISVFGIAVGFMESAVVVYLRELYYPHGFTFPLQTMQGRVGLTELLRELSTLIILASIAFLAGTNIRQRFAWFFYTFAIWDIFYYVFLKLLINWPESLLTWDILFLLPTTWVGPVIAPVVVSLTMILFSGVLLRIDGMQPSFKPGKFTLVLLIGGATVVFISFILDCSQFMIHHGGISGLLNEELVRSAVQKYVPVKFDWWLFLPGMLLIYIGLGRMLLLSGILRKNS